MTHPEVKKHGAYHSISVKYKSEDSSLTEMFIGRFDSDKKYHLLGFRPNGDQYNFPEDSETDQDLGVVTLPKDKKNIALLVKGEHIVIFSKNKGPYSVIFDRANRTRKIVYYRDLNAHK